VEGTLMVERLEAWTSIVRGLQAIEDAVELIGGFELDEGELEGQLATIRRALKDIRGVAHDYIQPDKA
jgi:hypothetical protein